MIPAKKARPIVNVKTPKGVYIGLDRRTAESPRRQSKEPFPLAAVRLRLSKDRRHGKGRRAADK